MRRLTWVMLLVAGAVFALHTLGAFAVDPWDDALFFKRFAVNTVEHGVAAWNVDEGPVHGNTSQLLQLIATALVAVAPDHYFTGIRLVLGAALLGTFLLLAAAASRLLPRDGGDSDLGPGAVLLCGLAAPTVFLLVGAAMETTVALCALAGLLYLVVRIEQRALGPAWFETVAFAGGHALVYLTRPDASIIAFVVSAMVLYERGVPPWRQRRLLRLGAAALAGVVVVLVALRAVYGTAFPLSFYLKNQYLSALDSEARAFDGKVKLPHVVTWFLMAAPLLFLALFRRDRWNAALLTAAAAFAGYHFASTIEIMGFHGRFYVPAMTPLVLAAALAWPAFAASRPWRRILVFAVLYPLACVFAYSQGWLEPHRGDFYLSRVWPAHYEWHVAAALLLILSPLVPRGRLLVAGVAVPLLVLAAAVHASPPRTWRPRSDAAVVARMARRLNAMLGATDVKACMPEPLHIYHSEIGVIGLLFPGSHITDLSGLMNRGMVLDRAPFDETCLASPPDVFFLPHLNYKQLNREVMRSRCLRQFTRPRDIKRSQSTLYIRNDLVAGFNTCTAARRGR